MLSDLFVGDELHENRGLYTVGLENIKTNGVSDWLEKERTRLVTRLLAAQARKLQSMDELGLATNKVLRYSKEVALNVAK